jgi:hypothetical protein
MSQYGDSASSDDESHIPEHIVEFKWKVWMNYSDCMICRMCNSFHMISGREGFTE